MKARLRASEVGPQVLDGEQRRVHHLLPLAFEEVVSHPLATGIRGSSRGLRAGAVEGQKCPAEIVRAALNHVAPRGRGLLHAEAEVGETRLDRIASAMPSVAWINEQGAQFSHRICLRMTVCAATRAHAPLDEALLSKKRDLAAIRLAITACVMPTTTMM